MTKTDNLEELVREELNAQSGGNESQKETNQPQEKKEENQEVETRPCLAIKSGIVS